MNTPLSQSLTFGERVIEFNKTLTFEGNLPEGFAVMNPFQDQKNALDTMELFYKKFYHDHHKRKFLIGINPGRFGAAITGVPFTDTKRLQTICNINWDAKPTHEPSAVFIYKMIEQYGGAEAFYGHVYINSLFPLAIIRKNEKGNWVNCNYYDDKRLVALLEPIMTEHLKTQISFGVDVSCAYTLGKKNAEFLKKINDKEHLFEQIIPLEHPRYIQQYKSKSMDLYIQKYVDALKEKE